MQEHALALEYSNKITNSDAANTRVANAFLST